MTHEIFVMKWLIWLENRGNAFIFLFLFRYKQIDSRGDSQKDLWDPHTSFVSGAQWETINQVAHASVLHV